MGVAAFIFFVIVIVSGSAYIALFLTKGKNPNKETLSTMTIFYYIIVCSMIASIACAITSTIINLVS